MTLSQNVAKSLPYLRRYARALTGSQPSGDAYVGAVLESMVADPTIIGDGVNPRIALFRALSAIWGSVKVNQSTGETRHALEKKVQDRLGQIPALPRQVYLLNAVEGFSFSEISQILERPPADIAALHEQAVTQIASLMSCNVLIIEDEPLIAIDIEDMVNSMGHNVLGVARTRNEAVALAGKRQPDLVLSDIQLADGSSGIDAVNDILKSFSVPVIFITAFPERLLTGERPEPAFLIAKPFSPDMVKGVIAQAIFFEMAAPKAA